MKETYLTAHIMSLQYAVYTIDLFIYFSGSKLLKHFDYLFLAQYN